MDVGGHDLPRAADPDLPGLPRDTSSIVRERRYRRFPNWLAACAVALALIVATPVRDQLLRGAGWALVFDEPVSTSDAVVVAVDVDRSGLIEAADLVHAKLAPRVAVFVDPPSPGDQEASRRGLLVEDDYTRVERDLRALGVERIERIPEAVTGSEQQGVVLARWAADERLRSVIIVTGADHSRRVRRILNRTMNGHPTRVSVRVARYSAFNPETWWQTRGSLREGIEELQKLVFDIIRHPLS